jgi:hypothetical protein
VPISELLSQQGIVPYLVNGRHVTTIPGRKSDWNDAQWLQKLHALGLLQASFRPDAEIAALRTLVRYRAELREQRAPHILHRQRAQWRSAGVLAGSTACQDRFTLQERAEFQCAGARYAPAWRRLSGSDGLSVVEPANHQ